MRVMMPRKLEWQILMGKKQQESNPGHLSYKLTFQTKRPLWRTQDTCFVWQKPGTGSNPGAPVLLHGNYSQRLHVDLLASEVLYDTS